MPGKIRLIIADDVQATRENICKLMEFHPDIQVVGLAGSAAEAIDKTKIEQPDVILMDINMPGMDGITATEIINMEYPDTSIIIMSVQGEKEYLRRAMMAGAKNYLVKPFTGDELVQAVKQAFEMARKRQKTVISNEPAAAKQGKVITVFSTKGGIGKTTIASNLAVALSQKKDAKIAILDADLQFGDVALFLNLTPRATLADLAGNSGMLDANVIQNYLLEYNRSLQLLAAPLRPEQADMVQGESLTAILKIMRNMFDYIIVDTAPVFNEPMLAVLDEADEILVLATLDLPTIKNIKLCLEIMDSLQYPKDKIKLLLNRANSESSITLRKVEETLKVPITASFPSDGKTVVASVNQGIPFVVGRPETQVAKSVFKLADMIAGTEQPTETAESSFSIFSRVGQLFG